MLQKLGIIHLHIVSPILLKCTNAFLAPRPYLKKKGYNKLDVALGP